MPFSRPISMPLVWRAVTDSGKVTEKGKEKKSGRIVNEPKRHKRFILETKLHKCLVVGYCLQDKLHVVSISSGFLLF